MADQLHQPNLIGQLSIEFYTVVLIGFALSPETAQSDVVAVLEDSTQAVTAAFPFLAGKIVLEHPEASNSIPLSGTYRVVREESERSPLRVKDFRDVCSSFEDLVRAKAPASLLDGDLLAPMQGLPRKYNPAKEHAPIFVVQANFVEGGVLLCFCCQHNVIDMNGQGKIVHLFAKACRGEPIPRGSPGKLHRLPLLRDGEVQKPHQEFRCPSRLGGGQDSHHDNDPLAPWRYYRFTHPKLIELKKLATNPEPPDVRWISTNDAVTAFVWQRVSSARLPRLSPETTTKVMRLVNVLDRLSPPVKDDFVGMQPNISTLNIQELVNSPLSLGANTLRRTLNGVDDHHVRSWITLINSLDDKTTINPTASITQNDLIVSSWADLGLATCDFGEVLARPAFIRRPRMADCEGLTYLMPRTVDGDIDVIISLRDEDFEALERDEVWKRFTEKIG